MKYFAALFCFISSVSYANTVLEKTENCFDLRSSQSEMLSLSILPTIDAPTRDAIFEVFQNTYKRKFSELNLSLEITEDPNTAFGAFAEREGNVARIRINQGTRYHQRLNPNLYAMILCHELGHHLGGAPRFADSWASVEGEADYFATLKCWRTIETSLPSFLTMDPIDSDSIKIQNDCISSYSTDSQTRIKCQHALNTALQLTKVLAGLSGFSATGLNSDATSTSRVSTTFPFANEPVCRWLTFRSGGLCPASSDLDVEAQYGACTTQFAPLSARPVCWFAGQL